MTLRDMTIFILTLLVSSTAAAQITSPGSYDKLRHETSFNVKSKVNPLLIQYCNSSCQIINVEVEIEEAITETDDLGFESVSGQDPGANIFVNKVIVEVQVDDRVTQINRTRLGTIIENHLKHIGLTTELVWRAVTIPQIGQSAAMEEQLKRQLQRQVADAIKKTIDAYCPEDCVLSQVAVDGGLVTPDEAQDYSERELVRDKSGRSILRIDQVDVDVSMSDKLGEAKRNRINNLFKARTRFATPVSVNLSVTEFPESFAQERERARKNSEDPFGLDKLRETLRIFREMAGTKEVITTNNSSKESQNSSSKNLTNSELSSSNSSSGEPSTLEWALYAGGLLLLAGIVAVVIMRFAGANRDAHMMMDAIARPSAGASEGQSEHVHRMEGGKSGLGEEARKDLGLRVKCQDMREALINIFMEAPKVAKETFTRLLQEEGVEETAKYVQIFGHLVVFELLADPNLQRELYELSEYYHKSEFDFTVEEEYTLLNKLKTRVTAAEIRVMSRKQMDKFDFLTKLDASQIFNLIQEEKPQLQSIVLTQLDHRRRRAVFDLYEGQIKINLMRELCRADAIPKEYLSNVAQALHKKVTSRPEFDTENLRASDILLDLLEKANLSEQRNLMGELMQTNQEAARGIKLRLVTVEMMPYLKDGHLLEIIMGLDREDLLIFLAGTRDHVRDLLLHKAPEELADSWIEDLENIHSVDEQNYRLIEMKVLSRIRNLANNGAVNLLDINDMIFGTVDDYESGEVDEGTVTPESDSAMVA